ncbi:MAG TPA: vWA domain-containing protein [Polyangia bacterium]|jgi:hypothetical protein|nr:vWA domain-containing protein [Polyangia bacterium]
MSAFDLRNVAIALVATSTLSACSFERASDAERGLDGGGIDIHAPQEGGSNFESDARVTCVTTTPMTSNLPPDILIVLDRSNSMLEDLSGATCNNAGCGATSKWSIATTTLDAFLPTVEAKVNFGLKLFSSNMTGCNVTASAEAAPRANNAAAISQLLGTTSPGSSTPTTAALSGAATYLKSLTDPNPKFILLATDGIPTCGVSTCAPGVNATNPNICDDANAIAMVKTVRQMGFPTFVLGIGTSRSPGDSTLSTMAVNGGYPRNGTPAYYPIDKPEDLTAAFRTITGMVSSCFFSVSPALDDGQHVTGVTGDGVDLPSTDYSIVGNNGVQLTGQACADFMSGTITKVAVQVSCIG